MRHKVASLMTLLVVVVVIVMVIVGGLRTFAGPILGAVFIEVLSEALRAWGEIRMVLFALLVIVIARAVS